jgi:uncharacterized protein (TIGR03435 family)
MNRMLLAVFATVALAGAQPLKFEVASVKANKSPDFRNGGMKVTPGGKISYTNIPLLLVIAIAYEVPFQSAQRLAGAPDWTRAERFDIEAAAPEGAIPPTASARERDAILHRMLQGLLEDRFKLVVRRETKEMPVYAVVVGKKGIKLDKSGMDEKDCPNDDQPNKVSCHNFHGGQGRGLHSDAATLEDAATFVSNWSDRPVVDQTGIKTLFRFDTPGWVPMQVTTGASGQSPEGLDDPLRPSLFGIFDRMGLKLESGKAPVETIQIVSVERPAAN